MERAARAHRLGDDQAAALRRICQGGERLACVVGPAGAGKTRMVRAARDAWAAAGTGVRGLAVSAVAAGVLAEEAGIPTETVAKFLHDARRNGNPTGGLRPGEALVVDEAAMLATSDLAALVDVVETADAKLVLVGDHRQLGAVEAGGLFRLLVADSHAAELTGVRRFSHPWEANATLRLRQGDDSVLGDYQAHGRITGGTRDDMIDQAHHRIAAQERYLRHLEHGRASAAGELERSRRRLDDTERAVGRITDVEAAIKQRGDWLLNHPAELAWEADLATRLARDAGQPDEPTTEHGEAAVDPAVEAALRSLDLRTIKLPGRRPRAGIERAIHDALGVTRHPGPDVPLPPLPGHGIDGPDLGL